MASPSRPDYRLSASEKRDAARRCVAGQARDAEDLRFLLTVMGLWPGQDDQRFPTTRLAAGNEPMITRRILV